MLVTALLFMLINLAVDLLVTVVDPRLGHDGERLITLRAGQPASA